MNHFSLSFFLLLNPFHIPYLALFQIHGPIFYSLIAVVVVCLCSVYILSLVCIWFWSWPHGLGSPVWEFFLREDDFSLSQYSLVASRAWFRFETMWASPFHVSMSIGVFLSRSFLGSHVGETKMDVASHVGGDTVLQ